MSGRVRIRLRKAAQQGMVLVRNSSTNLLLGIIVVALLVLITIGVLAPSASDETTGLLPLLQAQAISAISVALLALAAWIGFRLRFGAAKTRYLGRYRSVSEEAEPATPTHEFVHGVVDQLMASKPPRPLLVVTDAGALSPELERMLPLWMVRAGLMPVVIDVADCDAGSTVPALSRTTFVSRLAGASGDEARAERLFLREADRSRLAVLILGLDKVVEGKPRAARRATVHALLRSSLDERLPFVAAVSEELAPTFSEVAVIRVGPQREEDLGAHLSRALVRRGAVASPETTEFAAAVIGDHGQAGDPWYVDVAADVVADRVRAGADSDHAVREVFGTGCVADRELAWLYEKALGCDPCAGRADSAVARTLGLVGTQAHYRQDLTTLWRDVTRDLSAADELRFASGVAQLSRRGVLDITGDAVDPQLQFTHPRWLALAGAVGFGLDSDRWSDLLTPGVPQPTVEALTAALLLAGDRPSRSFLTVLRELKKGNVGDLSLDMISAVLRALQSDGGPVVVGDDELAALRRTWRPATDEARLLFVGTVDAQPAIARFLWDQIVPPRFEIHSYRLRRAIAAKLAAMGEISWTELAPSWRHLVTAAADTDLSARARLTRTGWTDCGLPAASLSWVLPSLVDRLGGRARAEALRLLEETGRILTEPDDRHPEALPDPGLEISLAEGYKLASVVRIGRAPGEDPPWLPHAVAMLGRARSWVSEQALRQAIALAAPAGSTPAAPPARHPFVREAIALTRRTPARDVWFDDVQALVDGGFALSAEAHRLLGLSTLLINLAEGEHARAEQEHRSGPLTDQDVRRVDARVRALTADTLPRCFVAPAHTVTMLEVDCNCPFRLCGPKGQETIGHRQISRAFARHAEHTAAVPPVSRDGVTFTRRQFAEVWRRPEITRAAD